MTFEPATYALAIGAGLLAGVINTVAGSGSLVTLPLLIFLGLPPHIANGTNRVGVALQNVVGLLTLKRHGALDLRGSGWFIVPTLLGAAAGAGFASEIDEQVLKYAILGVMLAMLVVLFVDPKKWIAPNEKNDDLSRRPSTFALLGFVAIGFYGGFIQAGVGILLLVGLVMGASLGPMQANGVKLFLTLLFTTASLAIFAWNGQVDWAVGGVVALGQMLGAYLAARFLANSDRAGVWIRRCLIAVVAASCLKFIVSLV